MPIADKPIWFFPNPEIKDLNNLSAGTMAEFIGIHFIEIGSDF